MVLARRDTYASVTQQTDITANVKQGASIIISIVKPDIIVREPYRKKFEQF